jgi:hypothetical protein
MTDESEWMQSKSGSNKPAPVSVQKGLAKQTSERVEEQDADIFAFGLDAIQERQTTIATVTIQATEAAREFLQEEDTGMYDNDTYQGAGGDLSRERGDGLAFGGGSPPLGDPGRYYPQGNPYPGPPAGPLGEGGSGHPGGGGGGPLGGGVGPPIAPQGIPPPLLANRSLKGTTPSIFDGNCKNMKQFTQEFTLYRMINQETGIMKVAYTRTALALSFMRGPLINDWVLQQTEKLYTKCNGDILNGIAPTHRTDDKCLWMEFGQEFCQAFADMALE